jgi:aryl carrier-like protein
MVSVVALLCAATMAQSDCGVDNAIDVIRLPDATSELNCVQGAMVTLASLAIQPTNGEYWKIMCARPEKIELDIARRHRSQMHHRA